MDATNKRDWGMFAAGIALIIAGFIFLLAPGLTLVSIAAVAGVMFLVVGAFDVYYYARYRKVMDYTGWMLASAICDIILGIMFLVNPIIAAEVIPWVAGAFMAAYGIFEIVAGVQLRGVVSWGWLIAGGIVSILCGVCFFIWPASFAIFLAFFLMMRGVTLAVAGATPHMVISDTTAHHHAA
ncbi:MAG: hypothetical protein HFJ75_00495 [Eggerthellaceae bacterium]|nr:hypothetical protein [Eggerthellaceae bacterium]